MLHFVQVCHGICGNGWSDRKLAVIVDKFWELGFILFSDWHDLYGMFDEVFLTTC